jgi:hypothetical protein
MSLPDSNSVAPLYIENSPDWGRPVLIDGRCKTNIKLVRSTGEQRARKRRRPKFSITYSLPALNTLEFSQLSSQLLAMQRAPVVVPVWTDYFSLVSMPTVNSADIGLDTTYKKFKVGSWAYMVQAGKVSTFRLITIVGASGVLTFDGTAIYPGTGVKTFTAGARVYPCILGYFPTGARWTANRVNETDSGIEVEEL